MVPSLDQLLDLRILLVVGAIAIAVSVAVAVLLGQATKRGSRAENPSQRRRLAIVESLDLDRHRRLVILRRDGVEHLVLVGGTSDLIVEAGIERATDRRLTDLPETRGTRTEPEEALRARVSPRLRAEPDLVREPVAPEPARGADAPERSGTRQEPPPIASAPLRAGTLPTASEGPAASPVPPRRSTAPAEPAAGRSTPYRSPAFPRTTRTPTADAPRAEASVSRRSLATPVHRSTPPSPVPPEPDLDARPAQAKVEGTGRDDTNVPPPAEPAAVDPAPQEEARPVQEARPTEAGETADVRREPEAAAAASGGRDPIDRLEAEIARLLGRAPADHESR